MLLIIGIWLLSTGTLSQLLNPSAAIHYAIPRTNDRQNITSFGFKTTLISDNFLKNVNPRQFGGNLKNVVALVGEPRTRENKNPIWEAYRGMNYVGKVNFCTLDLENDNSEKGKLDCAEEFLDSRGKSKYLRDATRNIGGTQYNIRYLGQNLEYDAETETLLSCAPSTFTGKDTYSDTKRYRSGYCELTTNQNSNNLKRIPFSSRKDQINEIHHEMFGYSSALHKEPNENKIEQVYLGAPFGWNERGFVSVFNTNTNNKDIAPMDQTKQYGYSDFNNNGFSGDEDQPKPEFGKTVQRYECPDGKKYLLAMASGVAMAKYRLRDNGSSFVDSSPQILKFEMIIADQQFQQFGKIGLASTLVKLSSNKSSWKGLSEPFLLISQPFGKYGKLFLLDICSDMAKDVSSERLIDLPENIRSFGYDLTNVGNLDDLPGDEILVGAPQDNDNFGSISVLATRENRKVVKFIQTIAGNSIKNNDNIKFLGLAASSYTRNIDGKAGNDVMASASDAVVLIPSNPVFALASDVEIQFVSNPAIENTGDISVFPPSNNQKMEEIIRVCIPIKTNLDLNKIKQTNFKASVTLELDKLRDGNSKRFYFKNSNKVSVEKIELSPDFSNSGTLCSEKLSIIRNEPEKWSCTIYPDLNPVKYEEISTPIRFEVSEIKRVKDPKNPSELPNDFQITKLESSHKSYRDLTPKYECSDIDQCGQNNFDLSEIGQKIEEIGLSDKAIKKELNLQLTFSGALNKEIYGLQVKIKVSHPSIVFDPKYCYKSNGDELVFNCLIPDSTSSEQSSYYCPAKTSLAKKDFTLKYEIKEVIGQPKEFEITYSLVQSEQEIGKLSNSKNVKTLKVINTVNPSIISNQWMPLNVKVGAGSSGKNIPVNIQFSIENRDSIPYYLENNDIIIYVPVLANNKIDLFDFSINDKNEKVYDYNFEDVVEGDKGKSWKCEKKFVGQIGKLENSQGFSLQDIAKLSYDKVICRPGIPLKPGLSFGFKMNAALRKQFFSDMNLPTLEYGIQANYQVTEIGRLSGNDQIIKMSLDVPDLLHQKMAIQEFTVEGLDGSGGNSNLWTWIGIGIAVLVLIVILVICFLMGCFSRDGENAENNGNFFVKILEKEDETGEEERDEETVPMRSAEEGLPPIIPEK